MTTAHMGPLPHTLMRSKATNHLLKTLKGGHFIVSAFLLFVNSRSCAIRERSSTDLPKAVLLQ